MAETLNDWRLIESEDTSSKKQTLEQSKNTSSINKSSRVLDTSNKENVSGSQSFASNNTLSNESASSGSISYNNNTSQIIQNNDDIFTENNVINYATNDIENKYEIIVGAFGEAYGKIFNDKEVLNVNGNEAVTSTYSKIKDVHSSGASIIGQQLMYTQIKDAITSLVAKQQSSSAKNGGNDSSSSNTYSDNIDSNPNGSASSNPSMFSANGNSLNSFGSLDYNDLMEIIDTQIANISLMPKYDKLANISNSVNTNLKNYSTSSNDLKFSIEDLKVEPSMYDVQTLPDAMSNMYDVYFRIVTDDGADDYELKSRSGVLNALLCSRLMSARILSIEIPSMERQTATLSALGSTIERPTDVISTPGKSSFTIRGDTRLYYVDAFNELSGTQMGDLLSKGSAIYQAMADTPIAQITNEIDNKSDEIRKQIEEELEKVKEDAESKMDSTAAEMEELYKSNKKDYDSLRDQAAEDAEKQGITQAEALKNLLNDESEKTIAKLNKDLEKDIVEAQKKNEGTWAAWKAERAAKNNIKSKIKEEENLIKQVNEQYDKVLKAANKAIADKEKELKKVEKDANTKKRKAIASLEISAKKDALDYITGIISKNTTVRAEPASSIDEIRNFPRIDLIVKRTTPSTRFITKLSDKKDERFVFEDIKLLGSSTPISFEREGSGPVNFTYDFIYKRCYKVDLYDTSSQWVMSQIDLLTDKVLCLW